MGRAETDAELVAASRRGEQAAFGRLVVRYAPVVRAVSFSATGDRALSEDVAQDTFLQAWTRLGSLREVGALRGWLCAIARNLGLKANRRRGREVATDAIEDTPQGGEPSPLEATLAAESSRIVWDALRRIPAVYREALVLYYQEGRSAAEVAQLLGLGEDAVAQRLSRGRRLLQEGVADLVERSLTEKRPRRDLAAAVLAALPAVPARPMSSIQHPGGTSMWKLAAIGSVVAVAGGATAVGVVRGGAAEAPVAAKVASEVAPAAPPGAAGKATRESPPHLRATGAGAPGAPCEECDQAEPPDESPRIGGPALAALQQGPSRGPLDAPVQIVLFTDFQCPYCEKVVATVDQLFDEYPGKLRLVIKQFPVHDGARLAAEASLAAEAQGKFWPLHDLLMTNQEDLSKETLLALGAQAGLDMASYGAALEQRTYQATVEAEQAAGKAIEVRATPAFLINGRLFTGALPIELFREAVAAELKGR